MCADRDRRHGRCMGGSRSPAAEPQPWWPRSSSMAARHQRAQRSRCASITTARSPTTRRGVTPRRLRAWCRGPSLRHSLAARPLAAAARPSAARCATPSKTTSPPLVRRPLSATRSCDDRPADRCGQRAKRQALATQDAAGKRLEKQFAAALRREARLGAVVVHLLRTDHVTGHLTAAQTAQGVTALLSKLGAHGLTRAELGMVVGHHAVNGAPAARPLNVLNTIR